MSKISENFESELVAAAKVLRADSHNSNSAKARCDRAFCVPVLIGGHRVGLSILAECKENSPSDFDFARISKNQRRHLDSHYEAAGISVILIKWKVLPFPRYFFCHWPDWMEMEEAFGFSIASTVRRRSGTASFSLLDAYRPETVTEFFKVQRPNGLGSALNLAPLVAPFQVAS